MITIQREATASRVIADQLETIKQDIVAFSKEHNVSATLMFCCIQQWANDHLSSPID